jgi:hypothetical protein
VVFKQCVEVMELDDIKKFMTAVMKLEVASKDR